MVSAPRFPGFTAHPLILPLQLIFGRVAVEVLVDILIHIEGQRSTQLSHDLKGLQIPPQRFQRAHMEDRPPGFIKLSLQIAVDVDALTAIVDDGHKVKFVGGELYPFVPAPPVRPGAGGAGAPCPSVRAAAGGGGRAPPRAVGG